MPSIAAFIHTFNSARSLGRALETLHPCDEILIADGGSSDDTLRIAREYGAQVFMKAGDLSACECVERAQCDWIFCLDPNESFTEALAASLYEWKITAPDSGRSANVFLREEIIDGWRRLPRPQTRLVTKNWTKWDNWLPAHDSTAKTLEGDLIRFQKSSR